MEAAITNLHRVTGIAIKFYQWGHSIHMQEQNQDLNLKKGAKAYTKNLLMFLIKKEIVRDGTSQNLTFS